jgi:hypothetical protein
MDDFIKANKESQSSINIDEIKNLELDLSNTILPNAISKIILKYTETIIKVEFNEYNNEITYYTQS